MTEISIKTGNHQDNNSNCGAQMEICDVKGICCKTSNLDNEPEVDREKGKTDIYKNPTILGSCAEEVGTLKQFI